MSCIGRRIAAKRSDERELARVADLDPHVELRLARAVGERGGERGGSVEAGDRVPRGGEVERHPPGPAAELEHRGPATRSASSLPEREVGRVAAALDVVPDHLGVRRDGAHSPELPGEAARASSVRSSSSAV